MKKKVLYMHIYLGTCLWKYQNIWKEASTLLSWLTAEVGAEGGRKGRLLFYWTCSNRQVALL